MRLLDHRQRIAEACETVERARSGLKEIYQGLDPIIDQVCDITLPWLAIPEAVTRPIIVCSWGMTGTGKTSMVRNLCAFIKRPLIQADLGSFTQDKDFAMEFYRHYADHSGTHSVILLDEIQNPRTISSDGEELDREGLRGMWSLLSDGLIVPDVRLEKDDCIVILESVARVYDERRGEPPPPRKKKQTAIVRGGDIIVVDDDDDDDDDDEDDGRNGIPWEMDYDHRTGHWTLDRWLIERSLTACNRRGLSHRRKVEQQLERDFRGTVDVLLSWLYDIHVQPMLDYSRCMIFITGNVDEVYDAANITNPDITADSLNDWSRQITVPDIKQSLLQRFRAEQVARLGSNHLLFPTLRERDFRDIIQHDLKRVIRFHSESFDVDLEFDRTVEDLIYLEGVFPTQGARPVLATMSTMVDGVIPLCLMRIAERYEHDDPDRCRVRLSMASDPAFVRFDELLPDGQIFRLGEMPLTLAIESLRRPVFDDDHVSVAIHEAGHAVVNIVEGGMVPNKVCAFSTDTHSMGFVDRRDVDGNSLMTREQAVNDMVMVLSGRAAERHLLGPNHMTEGSQHDIEMATEIATDYIKVMGFGDDPMTLERASSDNEIAVTMTVGDENKIRALLRSAMERSELLVTRETTVILDVARTLLSTSSMSGEAVLEICERHGRKRADRPSRRDMFLRLLGKHGMDMIER